jgi:hypothetical protein
MKHNPGTGATPDLSLRVSVATLARVIFRHPINGEWMLALERKATLHPTENGHVVEVKSQPFGGAIRILDLNALHDLIGDYRFDSERSRSEQDFRIFIRPSDWPVLREFCIQHLSRVNDLVLETVPMRELAEEFADALKIKLHSKQYIYKPVTTVVENDPSPTGNIHARGISTVRVFRIFEAVISDAHLIQTVMHNSESISHEDLCELALNGKGRANAILALPLKRISDYYLATPPIERIAPVLFEENRLDETVTAILDGIAVPKYQKL